MRRMVTVFLSSVMATAILTNGASALTLTARHDPDDVRRVPDIRTVWSDAAGRHVYVRVKSWERLTHREVDFQVWLDTRGASGAYDRGIDLSAQWCYVWKAGPVIDVGETIGRRQSHRPDHRSVSCRVPARWFGIRKIVHFIVVSGEAHDVDRAPNDRRYAGL